MSDFERLKYEGRLAETERHIKETRCRLDGIRDNLRHHLDPFDPSESLPGDTIASQALDFARVQMDLHELLAQAAAIRKALGC